MVWDFAEEGTLLAMYPASNPSVPLMTRVKGAKGLGIEASDSPDPTPPAKAPIPGPNVQATVKIMTSPRSNSCPLNAEIGIAANLVTMNTRTVETARNAIRSTIFDCRAPVLMPEDCEFNVIFSLAKIAQLVVLRSLPAVPRLCKLERIRSKVETGVQVWT